MDLVERQAQDQFHLSVPHADGPQQRVLDRFQVGPGLARGGVRSREVDAFVVRRGHGVSRGNTSVVGRQLSQS